MNDNSSCGGGFMTLEELGFKLFDVMDFGYCKGEFYRSVSKSILLFSNGEYSTEHIEYLTQELHKAIELKMKELGWW